MNKSLLLSAILGGMGGTPYPFKIHQIPESNLPTNTTEYNLSLKNKAEQKRQRKSSKKLSA